MESGLCMVGSQDNLFLEAFVRMNMAASENFQNGDGDLGTDRVEGILLEDGRGPAPRGRNWER